MIQDAQMPQIRESKEDGRVHFFGILEDKRGGFIYSSAVHTAKHTRMFKVQKFSCKKSRGSHCQSDPTQVLSLALSSAQTPRLVT